MKIIDCVPVNRASDTSATTGPLDDEQVEQSVEWVAGETELPRENLP
jgi:hypothetical protein